MKDLMKHEDPSDRTTVKNRIQLINKKSSGSPIKVPEWKQAKLAQYFGKTSPKALKARQTKSETTNQDNQGAQGPLPGEPSEPESQIQPSKGPGPRPEECGRVWSKMEEKKTRKVLERWPFDPGPKSLGPQQGRQVKRLGGTTPRKTARKKDKDLEKQALALEDWLCIGTGGTSAPGKDLVKKNQRENV